MKFIARLMGALLALTLLLSDGAGARTQPLVVIDYQYDEAGDFHEGLAAVKRNGAWGYIDNLGRTVLPFTHRVPEVGPFSEGLAFVGDRYVDTEGKPALGERLFEGGLPFSQGLAAVQSGGQWGYIDLTGKFVIPPSYEAAGSFSEGLAPVRRGGLWGYITPAGEVKLPFQYLSAAPFSEGLASVEVQGRIAYIDASGRDLIKAAFHEGGDFHYGLAPVRRGGGYRGWGFVNTRGNMAIPVRYNAALPFSQGLAPVATDARWGFINVRGEKVIPNLYDEARPFSEGLAAVRQDGKWGYIRQ